MSKNPKPLNNKNGQIARAKSHNRELVNEAFNNQIVKKNEDGEYAPVGK